MKKQYILILMISLTLIIMLSSKTKTYTVKFVDDNILLSSIKIKKGSSIENTAKPTKNGYLFLNWVKNGNDYNVNDPIYEDTILEAKWIEIPNITKTYQITFNYGNETKTMSIKEGDIIPVPSISFIEDKYKFLGWFLNDKLYDFDTPVTSDMILIAKFEKRYIKINYDLNGGSGTIESSIEKGTIPNRPKNPHKFGYTFVNWTIDNEEYNFDTPLDENTTIKANYEANIYVSIMFDTDGGNNIPSQILLSGETIKSLDNPIKEGYTFLYWSLDGEKFDINKKIENDITLIAVYQKNNQ